MLLVWLLVPALFIALLGCLIGLGIWWARRKQGNGRRTGLSVMGCATLPLALLALLLFGVPFLTSLRSASADFEEGFGTTPGPEVTNLRGLTEAVVDTRTIYLAFDATPAAHEALTRYIAESPKAEMTDRLDSTVSQGGAPGWFKAGGAWTGSHACANRTVQEFHEWRDWDVLIIIDCNSDGRIYALFGNID